MKIDIDHPLWKGHALQQLSEFVDELDLMSAVRKWVEATRHLPDLTAAEKSLVCLLEQWLALKNAEYE